MRTIGILGVLVLAQPAWAQDTGAGMEPLGAGMELHGYVSQGFMASTDNDYLTKSSRGSFDFFEAAVNVSKEFSDQLHAGLQIYAQELGGIGNYQPMLDWAFVDYRPRKWFGIRAGRVRTPLGLYTESMDLDVARIAVLLPQSLYDATFRDFITTFNGASLYGRLELGRGGALAYDAYAGGVFVPQHVGGDFDVKHVVGARTFWETPIRGLRLGGSYFFTDFDVGTTLGDPMMTPITEHFDNFTMAVASVEFQRHDFTAAVEYGRWFADVSVTPAVFKTTYNQERAYAMLTWRASERLATSAYYSLFTPNVDNRDGTGMAHPSDAYQRDASLTLRIDVLPWWLVKLEGHYINGTAKAQAASGSSLADNWALFLLKTTVAF
jgi:hypothetical protein